MTSEGLGEMFEGDYADTGAGKFPLTSMGAEQRVSRTQTRERGPHRRERNFVLGYANFVCICKPVVLETFFTHKSFNSLFHINVYMCQSIKHIQIT